MPYIATSPLLMQSELSLHPIMHCLADQSCRRLVVGTYALIAMPKSFAEFLLWHFWDGTCMWHKLSHVRLQFQCAPSILPPTSTPSVLQYMMCCNTTSELREDINCNKTSP